MTGWFDGTPAIVMFPLIPILVHCYRVGPQNSVNRIESYLMSATSLTGIASCFPCTAMIRKMEQEYQDQLEEQKEEDSYRLERQQQALQHLEEAPKNDSKRRQNATLFGLIVTLVLSLSFGVVYPQLGRYYEEVEDY